jgi:hypothetical protein
MLCRQKLARFWQPRFHGFNALRAKKRAERLEHMHAKPSSRSGRIVGHTETSQSKEPVNTILFVSGRKPKAIIE